MGWRLYDTMNLPHGSFLFGLDLLSLNQKPSLLVANPLLLELNLLHLFGSGSIRKLLVTVG